MELKQICRLRSIKQLVMMQSPDCVCREQPGAYESQRGVLQLACAVVQALEAPSSQDWDKMASIEKVSEHPVHTLELFARHNDCTNFSVLYLHVLVQTEQILYVHMCYLVIQVLVSCASDPSLPSVISQVTDLVKSQGSPKADLLPLSALLAVCVAMFSLLGDTCVENQRDFDQMKVNY